MTIFLPSPFAVPFWISPNVFYVYKRELLGVLILNCFTNFTLPKSVSNYHYTQNCYRTELYFIFQLISVISVLRLPNRIVSGITWARQEE